MDNKKQEKRLKHISVFETLAMADVEKKERKTNGTIPSLEAVEEAKDWVDFNKL